MDENPAMFTAADYAVFGGMLLISVFIGVFYAWKDRNEKSTDAYLIAKGQMSPIPVAISLCVSYVSGIIMVGIPTQIYYFGLVIATYLLILPIAPWITGTYYIPLFFRLNITSVYEILEMRFGRYSRACAASSVVFMMITYMGMVTYIPCLSLSAVSDASMPLSIVLTCLVCTFYTTLGGIKAVIWTDVLQASVMLFGMSAVIIKGSSHAGGWDNIVDALERGSRTEVTEWSFDPRYRNSTWSILFGLPIVWIMMAAVNQPMVQRYLSCKNVTQARIAVWALVIPQALFYILALICGLVMYAYFETCDPRLSGSIEQPDQSLPYMVVNLFQGTPGVSGLFVAAVYSGTLSTISSGINALSAVLLSDYILKIQPGWKKKSLTISKVLVSFLGVVVLLMTFGVMLMGKMVIDIFFATFGSIGGPLLGVFTLGMFFPWANEKGAVAGQIVGMVVSFWISIGQAMYPPPMKYLKMKPITTSGCDVSPTMLNGTQPVASELLVPNTTLGMVDGWSGDGNVNHEEFLVDNERPWIADTLYAISNNYIGLVGFIICILVGVIVSGVTGFEDPKFANTAIFTPIADNKLLPEKIRRFFRFGVPVRQQISQSEKEDSFKDDDDIGWRKEETVGL